MCLKIKWYFFYKVFKLNSVDDPHLFDPELGSASGIWILLGLIFFADLDPDQRCQKGLDADTRHAW